MSPDRSDLDLSVVERHSSDSGSESEDLSLPHSGSNKSDKSSSVTCSENAIEDIVEVARANVIANEEAVVLTTLAYTTGWFYPMERYANSVLIGPSAGGKTLVQSCVQKLLPDECIYTATDFSANAMIDDPEWDDRLVAVLDEYDKVEGGVREMLKSMAGEDRGYTKKRNVENSDAQGGYAPEEISSHAKPFGILYAPRGKKASIDHELSTRMITIHVEDSKHIREAIGRKEAGHTNISIRGYDKRFIFDATDSAKAVCQRLRELSTVEGQSQAGYDGVRGSSYAYVPQWVWYAVRPIFNRDRTYTNRVYGQIFNLIRSSALLNHPNRPTANRTVEGEDVRANAVVQPQDVANVLSCQPTLLAQTHKLDPRKRAILEAVNSVAGMSDEGTAVLDDIREWLDANDKPCPSESTLRSLLKDDLREDWFIKVNDGAGPNGADLFSPRKETGLHPPRLTDLDAYAKQIDGEAPSTPFGTDLEAPFADCRDPIRNQPFVETVRQFREDFMGGTKTTSTDAASYMGADGDGDEDSADTVARGIYVLSAVRRHTTMLGIFSPVGVALFVIGAAIALFGLMLKNRRLGWTLTTIGLVLCCAIFL